MATVDSEQTIPSLTRKFAEDTSMHGVGRVASRRSVVRKVLWMIFVVIAFGVALYYIISVVGTYLLRPVATVLSIEHNTKLLFPAVTICNLNPIRLSQLRNATNNDVVYLANLLNITNTGASTFSSLTPTGDSGEDFLEEFKNPDPDDQFKLSNLISGLVSHMNETVKTLLGHQLEQMLLRCQFAGKSCNETDFVPIFNNKYGNCFIFNSDGSWISSQTGPQYGLELEFYIQEHEYIGLLADTLGVKVLVTDQRDVPMPDDEGVVVGSGFDTYIGLSKRQIQRASPPYGDCQETAVEEAIMDIIHGWGNNYNYSNRACMRACIQVNMIRQCGCCTSDLPCPATIVQMVLRNSSASDRKCLVPDGRPPTSEMDKDMECSSEVYDQYIEDELQCSTVCDPSCRETAFPTEVSTGLWPSFHVLPHYQDKVAAKHNEHNLRFPESVTLPLSGDFIRRNTLKMHIFYKLLNHESVVTRPSYDIESLISDIGGTAGLWLGFSVLTFMELLELLIDITISFLSKSTKVKPLKRNNVQLK